MMLIPFAAAAGASAAVSAGVLAASYAGMATWSLAFMGANLAMSLLAPTQKTQGPRLDDRKVIGSSYGTAVPFVIGHPRLAPLIVWASELREIPTTTESGKGGPSAEHTSFTYEGDLLLQFSCNRLAGIRKLFYNGKLIWTAGNDADFASINASGDFARSVRVFNGDPDQLPYSTYEAVVGIDNAPAFRGCLTVGIDSFQYGGSKQIGNITAEVSESITASVSSENIWSTPDSPWGPAIGTSTFSSTGATLMVGQWDSSYGTTGVQVYELTAEGVVVSTKVVQAVYSQVATSGSTDEALLANYEQAFGFPGGVVFADGRRSKVGQKPSRFAKKGDHFVSWNSDTSILKRYDLLGARAAPPTPVPTAAEMASVSFASVQSMIIQDDEIYILPAGAGVQTISVLDLETLTTNSSFSSPNLGAGYHTLTLDDSGQLHLVGQTTLYRYDGTSWRTVRSIPSGYGMTPAADARKGGDSPALVDEILYAQNFASAVSFGPASFRASWGAVSSDDIPLQLAVERIANRAEVDVSEFDLTAVADKFVRAAILTSTTPRQALELLASANFFEWCGTKAVPRGGAVAATIPWEDLGSVVDGDAPGEPALLAGKNDPELPAYVHMKGMNVDNDYQDGTESSDRLVTESNAVQLVEMPMGFTPTELKLLAVRTAADLQVSKITVSFSVQRKYWAIEPTDVVLLTLEDGSQLRVRILKKTTSGGLLKFEAVIDDESVYSLTAVTDTDYTTSTTVYRSPDSRAQPLDIPALQDADTTSNAMYVAIDHLSQTTRAATLFIGPDAASLEPRGQATGEAPVGFAESVLAGWQFNVMDNSNSFVVNLGDATMFNASRDDVFDKGANAWALGGPGRWEIGQSMNAAPLGNGRFRLSGHLRGRRGTERNTGNHAVGDIFVLLKPAGMLKPSFDISEINQPRTFKAITSGRTLSSGIATSGVNTGEILRPFNPVNLRKVKANNNDQALSWDPRTRLSGEFPSGSEVPADQTITGWEVDFFTSGAFTTKAGLLASANPSRLITSAEQTTLGLTPGGTLYVRVYPISALIGRGHYTQAIL